MENKVSLPPAWWIHTPPVTIATHTYTHTHLQYQSLYTYTHTHTHTHAHTHTHTHTTHTRVTYTHTPAHTKRPVGWSLELKPQGNMTETSTFSLCHDDISYKPPHWSV